MPFALIALETGFVFVDQVYFSPVFKNHVMVTPGAHQRACSWSLALFSRLERGSVLTSPSGGWYHSLDRRGFAFAARSERLTRGHVGCTVSSGNDWVRSVWWLSWVLPS
jgi:hypothetical protein